MKRFIIALSVLGVLLCGSFFSMLATRNAAAEIMDSLSELREMCVQNDESAHPRANELCDDWDKKRGYLCVLVNSGRLHELQNELVRIPAMIEADSDELLSVIDAAHAAATKLYRGEMPVPANFL